jgi:hypothetical protein
VIGTILFLPPMTLLFMMALQGNKHATTYEAVRANRHCQLSIDRADQNLFDLIPAGSGFLTIAISHPIFSQYCKVSLSGRSKQKNLLQEFSFSSTFPLSIEVMTLEQRRCDVGISFAVLTDKDTKLPKLLERRP